MKMLIVLKNVDDLTHHVMVTNGFDLNDCIDCAMILMKGLGISRNQIGKDKILHGKHDGWWIMVQEPLADVEDTVINF